MAGSLSERFRISMKEAYPDWARDESGLLLPEQAINGLLEFHGHADKIPFLKYEEKIKLLSELKDDSPSAVVSRQGELTATPVPEPLDYDSQRQHTRAGTTPVPEPLMSGGVPTQDAPSPGDLGAQFSNYTGKPLFQDEVAMASPGQYPQQNWHPGQHQVEQAPAPTPPSPERSKSVKAARFIGGFLIAATGVHVIPAYGPPVGYAIISGQSPAEAVQEVVNRYPWNDGADEKTITISEETTINE